MSAASERRDEQVDVDLVAAHFELLDTETHRKALLEAIRARDAYRKLIDELRAKIAKLEEGLIGPKRERFRVQDKDQLSINILAELLGKAEVEGADAEHLVEQLEAEVAAGAADAEAEAEAEAEANAASSKDDGGEVNADPYRRPRKPTGRSTARESVHEITLEMLPDEVKRLGLDAFDRIGEEKSTTTERRVASMVKVTIVRPTFRAKTEAAVDAVKDERKERDALPEQAPESWITTAPAPEHPIPRCTAGPGLVANVATRRFDDHLPYHRLEAVYEREGMRLGRSTLYGWLDALRELFAPLVKVMHVDARAAPYVCVDATGVLVQAPEKCARGHFWVLVVPGRHVLFAFSDSHDSDAVDKLLGGYDGFVVADAHAVYDHLYGDDAATEVSCWSHARSYVFKALGTEPEIARELLDNLRIMFLLERKFAGKPRKQRERLRQTKIKALVDRHFDLCRTYETYALDGTPLAAAIRYSLNQEKGLRRFLEDGRLPATNNISERQLRRQAVGRRNWIFVGSEDGAAVNTTFTTLIASCHLHDLEPEAYLREVMCLLPDWPRSRLLELAPCNWKKTRQQPQTQQLLEGNFWLGILREIDLAHARAM